jgi:hypothetical protein
MRFIPNSEINNRNLRAADSKRPRSGRMNLAGPFKARTGLCLKIPSRQRRMSSIVADATHCLPPIRAGLEKPA